MTGSLWALTQASLLRLFRPFETLSLCDPHRRPATCPCPRSSIWTGKRRLLKPNPNFVRDTQRRNWVFEYLDQLHGKSSQDQISLPETSLGFLCCIWSFLFLITIVGVLIKVGSRDNEERGRDHTHKWLLGQCCSFFLHQPATSQGLGTQLNPTSLGRHVPGTLYPKRWCKCFCLQS